MPDWDEDSPQLEENVKRLLREIRQDARRRTLPTVESARRWQVEIFQDLRTPNSEFLGAFRGEAGLEDIQVRIAGRYGVAAPDVSAALERFERILQRAVHRLDELLPPDTEPDSDHCTAILEVCAWVHAEWVRIHPFTNGNGRTARLWANSLAMRYGLPPFLRLRPRPEGGYGIVSRRAMLGDWKPTVTVFQKLIEDFLNDPGP
jgi:fido (protein-threonine AMPylation protein)